MEKWELINLLRSCGVNDASEALKLKSLNVSDIKILAHYGVDIKTYTHWAKGYSSKIGKSVMIRKRGKLISMVCNECGGIIRFAERGDRICDKCGLIVDSNTQAAERIRFALRELNHPIKSQHEKDKIKNLLTLGKSETEVIRIMVT
jgi:hypothetical protein